jgi:hypothetical protein
MVLVLGGAAWTVACGGDVASDGADAGAVRGGAGATEWVAPGGMGANGEGGSAGLMGQQGGEPSGNGARGWAGAAGGLDAAGKGANGGQGQDSNGGQGGALGGPEEPAVVMGPEMVVSRPLECPGSGTFPPVYGLPWRGIAAHDPLYPDAPDYVFRIAYPGTPRLVRLDPDTLTDLAVVEPGSLEVYRQTQPGVFAALSPIVLPAGDRIQASAFGDLDGDGSEDVVLFHHSSQDKYLNGRLEVYRQGSSGFASAPDQVLAAVTDPHIDVFSPLALTIGDLNGDGRGDIVLLVKTHYDDAPVFSEIYYRTSLLEMFYQLPDGSFERGAELGPRVPGVDCDSCPYQVVVGDLDRDATVELVVAESDSNVLFGIPPESDPNVLYGVLPSKPARVVVYRQASGTWQEPPVEVATFTRAPTSLKLDDVNQDGRTDLVGHVSGQDTPMVDPRGRFYEGYSAVCLQQEDGTFGAAAPVTLTGTAALVDQVPLDAAHTTTSLDLVDLNGDGRRDLAVQRKQGSSGAFLQEQGLFATTPSLAVDDLYGDTLAMTASPVPITFKPAPGAPVGSWGYRYFSYQLADMDGDGRKDLVGIFTPFAPNTDPDPITGQYEYSGFRANTVTDLSFRTQRVPRYRLWVDSQEVSLAVEGNELVLRARVRNLSPTVAEGVQVRLLELPYPYNYPLPLLPEGFEQYATWARRDMDRKLRQIDGDPITDDITLGRLAPGQAVEFSVRLPVCTTDRLDARALFIIPVAGASRSLLYRLEYSFLH